MTLRINSVDSPDTLDKILLNLPIMKKHGQSVQIAVTAIIY